MLEHGSETENEVVDQEQPEPQEETAEPTTEDPVDLICPEIETEEDDPDFEVGECEAEPEDDSDAAMLAKIEDLEAVCGEAEDLLEDAKIAKTHAQKYYDKKVDELRKACRARHNDKNRPLFNQKPKPDMPQRKPDESWKEWTIEDFSTRDDWAPIAKVLRDKNELTTIGEFSEFVKLKGDFWGKDLKGIGPKKLEVVDEVNFRFWLDHPEFCGDLPKKEVSPFPQPQHAGKTVTLLTEFAQEDEKPPIPEGNYDVAFFSETGEPVIMSETDLIIIPFGSAWCIPVLPVKVELLESIRDADGVEVASAGSTFDLFHCSPAGVVQVDPGNTKTVYDVPFADWKLLE
jgi:hypothetical protein